MKIIADSGWIMCDDGTIGDVSSGATTLASSTTAALYTLLWTNFANAQAAVSTGRGVSAAADYAAHKTIALPRMLGCVYGIAGAGAGLTSRAMGLALGEETHQLTTSEMPSHTHTYSDPAHSHTQYISSIFGTAGSSGGGGGIGSNTGTTTSTFPAATNITINNAGSNTPHNTMQPTVFLKMMVKL